MWPLHRLLLQGWQGRQEKLARLEVVFQVRIYNPRQATSPVMEGPGVVPKKGSRIGEELYLSVLPLHFPLSSVDK